MSEPTNLRKTPRIVDGVAHLPDRPPDADELKWPLPAFFYEMRNVPFDEWTEFQVRRAIVQGEYLEYLIPRVLQILQDDLPAGGWLQVELLQFLTEIPAKYWGKYPDQKAEVVKVAQAALSGSFFEGIDEDWKFIEEDEKKLAGIIRTIASGTIPVTRDFRHNTSFAEWL